MTSFRKQFMTYLWEMRGEGILTDITLRLPDDTVMPCHKIVLMAASPFFRTMFKSGLKESSEEEVTLNCCSADVLKMLLKYFYTDDVNLNADNVQDVVTACEFLCLVDLKLKCEELMASLLDASNCSQVYMFAKKFSMTKLESQAHRLICDGFEEVAASDGFQTLTENELVEIVSDDGLQVENEDVVFTAVVHWTNGDLDHRKESFPKIARHIRFPYCSKETLTNVVPFEELMCSPECLKLVQEAQQVIQNTQHYFHSQRTIPRHSFTGKKQRLVRLTWEDEETYAFHSTECTDGEINWSPIANGTFSSDLLAIRPVAASKGFYMLTEDALHYLDISLEKVTPIPWKKPSCADCTFYFFNGRIYNNNNNNNNSSYIALYPHKCSKTLK